MATALARVQSVADDAIREEGAAQAMLVHVRFYANGEIFTIDAKPESLSARDWFNYLLGAARPYYQVLAGGRGFFRIPGERFAAILKELR
jgi:hypothetical protein